MSDSASPEKPTPSAWMAWAQLVRLPNVFTVLADVSAAFLLVAHGPQPVSRFVVIVLAGVSLYWAGMILNDVFDVERDRAERPTRPIPAGHITLGKARAAGWLLLLLGVVLAGISGYLPSEAAPGTWLPLAVAVGLALMIVAYDGPLKKTPLAPAAMGCCRTLSFLLGAASGLAATTGGPLFPNYILGIALGFGVYVMGITTMARQEAVGGASANLVTGLLVIIVGSVMLALAPKWARDQVGFHTSTRVFPFMIGLIAAPVVVRGYRAATDPTPIKIQTTIKVAILTIIPLAASFAFLGAGPIWGMLVFALMIPSIALAIRFRVT